MRWLIVILFGVALSVALPVGGMDASAAKKVKSRVCTASSLDNKKVSWKCKAGEKCCFDTIMSKGSCAAASAMCL